MQPICFGRYVLLDRIAAGGMGEVYVAVPRTLWGFEKFFAIKKMLPALSRDSEFQSRFRDEARLVIPMNHPNVVQVYEVGRVDEDYFLAMELVEGQSLGQLLGRSWQQRQPLPVAGALYVVRELLAGLEYCHRRTDEAGRHLAMVHRDVSPSNVLVAYEGAVKLADFGLALSKVKSFQTRPNVVLGHIGYIAPEALEGKRQDQRSDIFSAGVLLFELLTAQRFCDPACDPVVARHELRTRAKARPSSLRAGIPIAVDNLVQRALAWNPEDRYQTARAFHDDVQQSLVRLDALFGANAFAETVMRRFFDVDRQQQRLRALLRRLDLDEIEARQPAGRTFCIGEAIPLTDAGTGPPAARAAKVLTMMAEVTDGDTQPVLLGGQGAGSSRVEVVSAELCAARAAWRRRPRWHTPAPSLTPTPARRSETPVPSRRRRFISSKTNQ